MKSKETEATYTMCQLAKMLDMIGTNDFRMVHRLVAEDVASGRASKEFEDEYRKLVDAKLSERGQLFSRVDDDEDDEYEEDEDE